LRSIVERLEFDSKEEERSLLYSNEFTEDKQNQGKLNYSKRIGKEALQHGKRALKYSKRKSTDVVEKVGGRAEEMKEEIAELGLLEYGRQVSEKVMEMGAGTYGKGIEVGGKWIDGVKAKGSRVIDEIKSRVSSGILLTYASQAT
jgi:hypothetical protein